MRVLIAVHHYPPNRLGGAELIAQRQAQWLNQHGIETRVVCVENISLGRLHMSWQDDEVESIPVRRLNLEFPDKTLALAAMYDNPVLTNSFSDWISEWTPDLVHLISGYLLGTAPLQAALRHNLPTVITLTDFWFLCPTIQLLKGDGSLCTGPEPIECARCFYDSHRAFRIVDRQMPRALQSFWGMAAKHGSLGRVFGVSQLLEVLQLRSNNLIAALNEAEALLAPTHFLANMYRANGVTSDNLLIMPYGLEINALLTPEDHTPSDEILFGYMGQIAPIKGIDLLVRAFRLLRRANPGRQLRLVIYGKLNAETRYVDQLKKLAEDDPAVTFAGAYENSRVLRLLSEMTALVVPSTWHENAPLVVQEAFAARTPVIGSDVGGITELVKDGENGLVFSRGDAADLARQLQRILDEPDLPARLKHGIPPVRTHQQEMNELMQVYTNVLHGKRTAAS